MSEINVITATFGSQRKAMTMPIMYQHDVVQMLKIRGLDLPTYFEVEFCNDGDTTTVNITGSAAEGAQIPDSLIQTGRKIKAYIVLTYQDSVQTRYEITIPVYRRPLRNDIDPTDDQQLQIDALVAALNDAINRAEAVEDLLMGGDEDQILRKNSDDDLDFDWSDETKEIFWATYGETSLAEIRDALAAGKTVYTQYNGQMAPLVADFYNYVWFITTVRNSGHWIIGAYYCNANGWTYYSQIIPEAADTIPQMDGVGSAGSSTVFFARADHVHPSDTSKANVEDVPTKTSDLTNDSGYITEDDLPDAATAAPLMDGTAAVGSSSKYAKEDHVHPSDTSKITMPDGGSAGQVLKKTASGTEWADESGGSDLPSGGLAGEPLVKISGTSGDVGWGESKFDAHRIAATISGSTVTVSSLGSTFGVANTAAIFNEKQKPFFVEFQSVVLGVSNEDFKLPLTYRNSTANGLDLVFAGTVRMDGKDYVVKVIFTGVSESATSMTGTYSKTEIGGSGGTTEIFDAIYGTTTVSEIETAISNGKLLRCTYDGQQYYLGFTATSLIRSYIFFKSNGSEVTVCSIDADTGVWSHGYRIIPSAYNSNPAMDGTASAGSSTFFSRGDHVHPSDTTKADKVTVTTVSDAGAVSQALDAGKIYDFTGALTSLTITLNAAEAPAQYHFCFQSGSTAPTLTLPNTVVMPSGFQVAANKHYEIDILDGYGVAQSW